MLGEHCGRRKILNKNEQMNLELAETTLEKRGFMQNVQMFHLYSDFVSQPKPPIQHLW